MTSVGRVLRNQVRGATGALVVSGVVMLLTAEMWRLATLRPATHLLVYAAVGLSIVLLIARSGGFRVEEESGEDVSRYDPARLGTDFAELVLQSLVATFAVLSMYGVVDRTTPPDVAARLGLLLVVPLGFGAALANRVLREAEAAEGSAAEQTVWQNLGVFAAGAIFFTLPLGASVEIRILAATADWTRLAAIVVASLGVTYLMLYELEFRGQSARRTGGPWSTLERVGQTCVVYAVGVAVSTALLWGFGYLGYDLAVDVQLVTVLSFPTSVGGATARVVL